VPNDEGKLTLTLRVGDEAVVDTPSGPVTVRAVREEPGRVRVVIVAPRDWPIRREPRAEETPAG
jgi:hypothetical protein